MLDFDNKVENEQISINDFTRKNKDYHFILYTSSHHLKKYDSNNIPIEKYRVILPFDPNKYSHFDSKLLHSRAYSGVKDQFPEMDTSPTGSHSKFYPSAKDNDNFFVKVNVGKGYFYPEVKPKLISFTEIKKVPRFTLDTEVLDENKKIWVIRDIMKKMIIFCPFCDHEGRGNPDGHNASIQLDDLDVPMIYCASCDSNEMGINKEGVYFLEPDEKYKIQSEKLKVIVFRDILTDHYYLGDHSKRSKEYQFTGITKQNIPNALINRGLSLPKNFDEVEFDYDFTSRGQILDVENGFVNRYIPPQILISALKGSVSGIPKYIEKTMLHIVGGSRDVFDSLINHLAHMVQTGEKLRVAFLFQGVQGTGKGIWFNSVIAKIFGRNYCTQIQQRSFIKEFNAWLENNYCLLVDEVEANFNDKGDQLARVLKQIIGDRWIAIEGKGSDIKNGRVNANLFFATNKRNGLLLEPSDRRFIIGDWQGENIYEQDWWLGDNKMVERLDSEAEDFTSFLKSYKTDQKTLNRVVHNDAREVLIDFSKTNTTMFFDALLGRDWDWMLDNLIESDDQGEFPNNRFKYAECQNILNNTTGITKISRNDVNILYNNIFQDKKKSVSFTKLCKLHGIKVKQMKINGENVQGVELG